MAAVQLRTPVFSKDYEKKREDKRGRKYNHMAAVRARLPDCSLSYKSGQNNADAVLSQDKKDRKSKKQKKKT